MLHGSINHVALTVSDLPEAMRFLGPDGLKFEVAHMPVAERAARERGLIA